MPCILANEYAAIVALKLSRMISNVSNSPALSDRISKEMPFSAQMDKCLNNSWTGTTMITVIEIDSSLQLINNGKSPMIVLANRNENVFKLKKVSSQRASCANGIEVDEDSKLQERFATPFLFEKGCDLFRLKPIRFYLCLFFKTNFQNKLSKQRPTLKCT